jgi:hypothetical protein
MDLCGSKFVDLISTSPPSEHGKVFIALAQEIRSFDCVNGNANFPGVTRCRLHRLNTVENLNRDTLHEIAYYHKLLWSIIENESDS